MIGTTATVLGLLSAICLALGTIQSRDDRLAQQNALINFWIKLHDFSSRDRTIFIVSWIIPTLKKIRPKLVFIFNVALLTILCLTIYNPINSADIKTDISFFLDMPNRSMNVGKHEKCDQCETDKVCRINRGTSAEIERGSILSSITILELRRAPDSIVKQTVSLSNAITVVLLGAVGNLSLYTSLSLTILFLNLTLKRHDAIKWIIFVDLILAIFLPIALIYFIYMLVSMFLFNFDYTTWPFKLTFVYLYTEYLLSNPFLGAQNSYLRFYILLKYGFDKAIMDGLAYNLSAYLLYSLTGLLDGLIKILRLDLNVDFRVAVQNWALGLSLLFSLLYIAPLSLFNTANSSKIVRIYCLKIIQWFAEHDKNPLIALGIAIGAFSLALSQIK